MPPHVPENPALPLSAILGASMLCLLFGSNVVAIKISLFGVGPFTGAAIRFSVAALILFIWAHLTTSPLAVQRAHRHHLMVISMIFICQLALFHFGISKTNASRGTLLANLQPFLVMVLAHFFVTGDRITPRKLAGLLLGFGGVACVLLEGEGITSDFRRGDFYITGAALLWACNAVYTKRVIHLFAPLQVVLYPMIASTPVVLLLAWIFDPVMFIQLDERIAIAILYQTLVTATFGFVAWNSMLKKYGAVAMHSFIFIMPIAGVLLGGLLLNEPITPKILLALVLIVAGIIVTHYRQKLEEKSLSF